MHKGHSRRSAEVMTQHLRESSRIVYEGHWKHFVTYCRNKGQNVFNVRWRHFSSYCLDLFDNDFQPGTIISHRTSIASVQRHWKYDPANDPHIALLLRSFRIARPVEHRTTPEWELHVVLSALDRVRAHEVRAISSSWAYLNQNVLAAAFWRSQGVFQRHYLRDLAQSSGDMFTLGPVAA